jgi:hypothetical protein
MTLTEEEVIALKWWIDWTKEHLEQTVAYSKEMELSGEVDRGYYQRQKQLFDTVLQLKEKI